MTKPMIENEENEERKEKSRKNQPEDKNNVWR